MDRRTDPNYRKALLLKTNYLIIILNYLWLFYVTSFYTALFSSYRNLKLKTKKTLLLYIIQYTCTRRKYVITTNFQV